MCGFRVEMSFPRPIMRHITSVRLKRHGSVSFMCEARHAHV